MTGTLELPQPLAPLTFDPQQANCRGLDPTLFHPARGDSPSVRAAVTVCNACTVRAECLQYALDNGIRDGVWGGTSGRERRQMWATTRGAPAPRGRRQDNQPIAHGTYGGYIAHVRRGDTPCVDCRDANTTYNREYRQRARGVA